MKPFLPLAAVVIAMAPADALRAETAAPVLEIVNFRLNSNVADASFVSAAAGTEEMLCERGALVRRYLVRDADGLWTDVIEWTSMEAALAAAEAVMQHPDFAPFGGMIDAQTVDMRHAQIRFRMD